ncbi:MAG: TlpA disulfide reductase family protein [Bacteroidota bacterium]
MQFIKKNFSSLLLLVIIGILLFNPNAKAFLLRTLLHTGIFNASTKKETDSLYTITAPALSFVDSENNRINTTELKGKIIFINFWATWCPPCIAEMSSINSLYNKLKNDSSIVFVLADTDNNFTSSLAFMKKNGYNLPVYQLASSVPENLFSGTIPATLIIDANGNIVQKHEGIANYDTKEMTGFLKGMAH